MAEENDRVLRKRERNREDAMKDYIRLATHGRKLGHHQGKKAKSVKSLSETSKKEDVANKFMMITIGRMVHDDDKKKGKFDRAFKPIKMPIHVDASYIDILKKCQQCCWSAEDLDQDQDDTCFYLADGSGTSIYAGGKFELVSPSSAGSTTAVLPWTLQNYLRVSRVTYPSRARIYIVKGFGSSAHEVASSTEAILGHPDDTSPTDESSPAHSSSEDIYPDGYFNVTFVEVIESRYRKAVSFRHGASQQEILTSPRWETDRREEILDFLAEQHDTSIHLFDENLLEFGYFLDAIYFKDISFSFVGDVDCRTGIVSYKQPEEGSSFDIWTGCYSCPHQGKCLLCCVAINGYHSCVTYQWKLNGSSVRGSTPLLYCSKVGNYGCTVEVKGSEEKKERSFHVYECNRRISVMCNDNVDSRTFTNIARTVEILPILEEMSSLLEDDGASFISDDTVQKNKENFSEKISEEISEGTPTLNPPSGCPSESFQFLETDHSGIKAIKDSLERPNNLMMLSVIGRGSFGTVHRAVWRGIMVAAKVTPIIGNERSLENELNVYRTLQHPHILSLLGVEYQDDSTILITNLVEGPNLNTALFGDEKLALEFHEKMLIIKQVCQAMVFMHCQQPRPIVHLDLKPANILIANAKPYHAFVADFGVAVVTEGTKRTTNMNAGTPGFQAPEQLSGKNVGPHSDIYAFGCIVNEVFTEKRISEGLSAHAIMFHVGVKGEYPPISSKVHPKISAIIESCFKEYSERATAVNLLKLICEIILC